MKTLEILDEKDIFVVQKDLVQFYLFIVFRRWGVQQPSSENAQYYHCDW